MSLPQAPFKNRVREYSSVGSAVSFDPPIQWLYVVDVTGGTTVTLKDEGGTSIPLTGLVGGDIVQGPFTELTSMTASKVRLSDGRPMASLATVGTSAATSVTTLASSNLSATVSADTSVVSRLSTVDSTGLSTAVSADASVVTRMSTVDSSNLSATVSADTSIVTRLSTVDSGLTSADSSLTTRDSAITSITTSLQSRISVAESTEASKG